MTGSSAKSITGASNNTPPIPIACSSQGYSTGNFVAIAKVQGNTATSGIWQITVTDSSGFTLNGSIGNGTYASSTGIVSISPVLVFKSTFGTSAANSPWYEWGLASDRVTVTRSDAGSQ